MTDDEFQQLIDEAIVRPLGRIDQIDPLILERIQQKPPN